WLVGCGRCGGVGVVPYRHVHDLAVERVHRVDDLLRAVVAVVGGDVAGQRQGELDALLDLLIAPERRVEVEDLEAARAGLAQGDDVLGSNRSAARRGGGRGGGPTPP